MFFSELYLEKKTLFSRAPLEFKKTRENHSRKKKIERKTHVEFKKSRV